MYKICEKYDDFGTSLYETKIDNDDDDDEPQKSTIIDTLKDIGTKEEASYKITNIVSTILKADKRDMLLISYLEKRKHEIECEALATVEQRED